ncbi:MAG: UPF0182 family protein, partial [Armatimonadota bacterium]|nr:UPF0182 family protein [Armatimonadota bacterium]
MNMQVIPRGEGAGGFRRFTLGVLAALLALVALFGSQLVTLYVDWLWFIDVGYRSVFLRTMGIKVALMLVASIVFFLVVYANLWLARRISPRPRLYLDEQHQFRIHVGDISRRGAGLIALIAAAVVSLTVGMGAAAGWYNYLLFTNPVEFGRADPIFHRDIGYYVFTFPFWRYVYRWLMLAVVFSCLGSAALYFVDRAIDVVGGREGVRVDPRVRVHLTLLVGVGLLLKAWGYWLARYEILFSPHGLFFGAGYTDVKVRLVVLNALVVLAAVTGLVVILTAKTRSYKAPVVAIGTWLIVALVGGSFLPVTVQKVRVTPNELAAEQPYIAHNIRATREAYNLDRVTQRDFPAAGTLRAADIEANRDTIESIRLWDYEPLLQAYRQLQTIRAYYTFRGADTDRYRFPEGMRQVALSVRELDVNKLGGAESSWINRHLIYTHGYGLSMSPVNRVATDGLPELIVRDFPPVTPPHMPLTQPQVYFGELTSDYVIVNTTEKEFDRPAGDENVTTTYEGRSGVSLAGLIRRMAFAVHFADLNLLISPAITRQSRILYGRSVAERVQRIVPFLRLDSDPYPVVHQGRIVWIVDAYTTSPWYPYSQRLMLPNTGRMDTVVSYMRNSVKVTVDAYDGTVRLWDLTADQPPLVLEGHTGAVSAVGFSPDGTFLASGS